MEIKNIVGAIIIFFNMTGLGFLFYIGISKLFKTYDEKEKQELRNVDAVPMNEIQPIVIDENIIPDEDDLLKDMDLSDLDGLDLDAFD